MGRALEGRGFDVDEEEAFVIDPGEVKTDLKVPELRTPGHKRVLDAPAAPSKRAAVGGADGGARKRYIACGFEIPIRACYCSLCGESQE